LETYARALTEKLAKSISDKEIELTGIPLQTRMLAEAFMEECKRFCLLHAFEPQLPEEIGLLDLYKNFIEIRLKIFNSRGVIAQEELCKIIMSGISNPKNHQKLALEVLLPELKDTVLKLAESDMFAPEAIFRIGIVQYVDDKHHFIQRTFAECYVANILATKLTKETRFLLEVLNILFKLLLVGYYAVIRFFLDGLLVNPEKPEVIIKYGKQIHEIWEVELQYTLCGSKKNS
jgi:hypothetical protein